MSYKTTEEVGAAMANNPNTVLIGLSLSYCIREMVKDPSLNVLYIVAGTRATTVTAFENVLKAYRQTYWQEFPAAATELATKLMLEGRIFQPRKLGYFLSIAEGYWIILDGFKENEVDPLKEVMEKKVRELELKKEYNDWLNNLIEKGIIGRCSVCGEPIAVKEGVCRKHAGKLF